jgi:hypothetical protein
MNPNWAEIIMALAAVGSFFVTAIGLIFLYIQLKKLSESSWSDTQTRLQEQSLQLIRFLAEKPESYDYFYNNKPLAETDPNRIYILYAAEALANFIEHVVLQQNNMPNQQWLVWERFIRNTYEGCSVLQEFFRLRRNWYSQNILSIIDDCDRKIQQQTAG